MTIASESVDTRAHASEATRWGQLIFGIICMVMIANLQYGWTLFVNPIDQKYHWGRAAIQVAFTIFVLTETWLVPVEGYLVDLIGPRGVVVVAGILVAAACPHVPPPLVAQLAAGGRLVQPIGSGGNEEVVLFAKREGTLDRLSTLAGAHFVPLIGRHTFEP